MEGFKIDGAFADGHELDGLSCDLMHGERGTAAGVTIEFRENNARDTKGLVEMLRNGNGFLTESGIADENDFVRLDFGLQINELLDEIVVDLQAAGGI